MLGDFGGLRTEATTSETSFSKCVSGCGGGSNSSGLRERGSSVGLSFRADTSFSCEARNVGHVGRVIVCVTNSKGFLGYFFLGKK
jgi:hypothetical protein